ncbi:hypothetical protein BXZ70DRAFT_942755 [Cristinia sonorae]|uniref:F-box domain-containing protein n=1 Tax=Cristinia sonorae TaxID=1940300 RepID=A0A8K0UP11_9AGAR|nr:hypothetical protein BXZ70DRAFT_942755 [Cristinia sonorae]
MYPGGLSSLPFELLLHIFSYLPGNDIIQTLSISRSYRTLVADEIIWRELCTRYDVRDLTPFRRHDPRRSFYTVYTQLLHKYGPLLGLWTSDNPFQGNVLEFRVVTEDAGWEGIVGEVWRFQARHERTPSLPDYFECVRIELTPSSTSVTDKPDGSSDETLTTRSYYETRSPKFTRVVHHQPIGEHKKPTLCNASPGCIRLNAPHSQGIYLYDGPPELGFTPSLHPLYPPPRFQDWLDPARLPRLPAHKEPTIDLSEHLDHVPWSEHEQTPLLYFAPTDPDVTLPQSITIVPVLTGVETSLYDALLAPQRDMSVTDIRRVVFSAFAQTDCRPFSPHYFPLHIPSRATQTPSPASPKLQELEGIWLGAYSSDGTEVLYFTWEESAGEVQVWKITGNSCVPRGALTWKIQSSSPIPQSGRANLLTEMGFEDDGSLDWSKIGMYEGVGIIADEGFVADTRGLIHLDVAVIDANNIRIIWTYEDGERGVLSYLRYPDRDVASEVVPWKCVRRPAPAVVGIEVA